MFKPIYRITPYLLNLIDEASSLKTWIELAPLQLAWLPLMQKDARARQAHFSTSIEGNALTLPEVKAVDRGETVGHSRQHELEVTNYLKAMIWISHNTKANIDEKLVFNLHQIITHGLLDEKKSGCYKTRQNYVVDDHKIRVHTPTSPSETPAAVADLLAWVNSNEAKNLHSILVCAIFHHRFVSIHPFSDGNGRLARAISTLILYQREFDLHHIFSLDEFFAGELKRYYQKIQQARGLDYDLTHWIEYVAEGVVATLKRTKKRIEDLQVTSSYPLAISRRQEETLRLLRDRRSVQVNDLMSELKVSRARINQLIAPLIKGGIIIKEGESRATRYKLNIH
ncbi:MAG: Fic family protein [Candidatus Margulisbacteria bacterium]|nr:Fic family protein [Candidatus Margulisiibacteriota bacterium]